MFYSISQPSLRSQEDVRGFRGRRCCKAASGKDAPCLTGDSIGGIDHLGAAVADFLDERLQVREMRATKNDLVATGL